MYSSSSEEKSESHWSLHQIKFSRIIVEFLMMELPTDFTACELSKILDIQIQQSYRFLRAMFDFGLIKFGEPRWNRRRGRHTKTFNRVFRLVEDYETIKRLEVRRLRQESGP